jgi:hypothetical protein
VTVFKIGIFLISCVSTHYCSDLVLEAPFQVLLALGNIIGCAVSAVVGARLQRQALEAPFQVLPALDNSIGSAISSVAGAGLYYWMRRFKCLLIANSAGANSNLPTPIACAAYSA